MGKAPEVSETIFGLRRGLQEVLVVGTSGTVSPARELPLLSKQLGAKVVEVLALPEAISLTAHTGADSFFVFRDVLKRISMLAG